MEHNLIGANPVPRPANKGDFSISFGTETTDISADTFVSSMLHLTSALEGINRSLDSGQRLTVRIRATSPGSFIVELHVLMNVMEYLRNLLTFENAKNVAALVGAFKTCMDIAKALKKQPPQSVVVNAINNTVNINLNGSSIEVPAEVWRIYNENKDVPASVNGLLDTVSKDETVGYLSVRDHDNTEIFKADKRELQEFAAASDTPIDDVLARKTEESKARLVITKPSFVRGTKWRVLHLGNPIGIEITDDDFLTKIDNGSEGFYKGDILNVELQAVKEWSEVYRTYVPKRYIVNHVESHEHATSPAQATFEYAADPDDVD